MAINQLSNGAPDGTLVGQNASDKIAFYGATPVVQQAKPTDAATIIALLVTLGLCQPT